MISFGDFTKELVCFASTCPVGLSKSKIDADRILFDVLSAGELRSPTETVRDVRLVGDPPIEALMLMDEALLEEFDSSSWLLSSSGS